jgi:outer membrane protein
MKHFTTLIVSLFLSLAPLSMMAQSKVAHINTQQLISEMPEVIAAQNELKKLEDQYAKELETFCQRISNQSAKLSRRC